MNELEKVQVKTMLTLDAIYDLVSRDDYSKLDIASAKLKLAKLDILLQQMFEEMNTKTVEG